MALSAPVLHKRSLYAPLSAVALSLFLGACNRTSGSAAAKDDLTLVPKETDVVLMVNVKQARTSALWAKFIDKVNQDAKAKKNYDEVVAKCHVDPFKQLDSVFVALPSNVTETKEFAVLMRGDFSPEKLVSCMVQVAKEKNETVTEAQHAGLTYYTIGTQSSYVTALPKKAVLLAGADWLKRSIDLSKGNGDSATRNAPLAEMIRRTKTADSLWWAGLVPANVSEKLGNNPHVAALHSLKSVSGSLDVAKGLKLRAYLDLGSAQDANQLKDKATEQLANLRKVPAVKMMGMVSFLDTVKVAAEKQSFVVDMNMTQQQVDDLIERLTAAMAQLR